MNTELIRKVREAIRTGTVPDITPNEMAELEAHKDIGLFLEAAQEAEKNQA